MIWILVFLSAILTSCSQAADTRKQISLNGEWGIAKTDTFVLLPSVFESKASVPGLVDLAVPALDTNRLYNQGIYWYKTNFTIDQDFPELVELKIGKAGYHARVYLNDKFVGEQVYCFTPAVFNVRDFLNSPGEENELLIGVGTVNNMPDSVIWGRDMEKLTYIPGIYDDVSLILSGYPFIRNIQTAPIIDDEKVRIVTDIDFGRKHTKTRLHYIIKELRTGKVVAEGRESSPDFTVHIPGCQLWTPDSPVLYELTLSTGADEKTVRFGMRTFSFDAATGRALLNGKPYYMRGTNVCIFRFFEDSDRGTLPWDNKWAIRLHQQFKNIHWNSMRYCIGFPPERWYDIADSLGFLIQDEYPVWTGGNPSGFERIYPTVTAEHLANEYRTWLREHWNHPSIVIWDAQNESVTPLTGEAINMVRGLDLSNRPWDNGWSPPQSDTDPVEKHPYSFSNYQRGATPSEKGALYDRLSSKPILNDDINRLDKKQYPDNPRIINEYGWLWLNRDGSTTTLTDKVYDVVFGENLSREERIYLYNRYMGMVTEYWRAHRVCAGVLHFCGLGYSRPYEPRGQTSDNFIDVKNLEFEPLFVKYVKPAFSPVGLMIDFWEKEIVPGSDSDVEVYAINDLDTSWAGQLALILRKGDKVISIQKQDLSIPSMGRNIVTFSMQIPLEAGEYQMEAEINYRDEPVKSIREFSVMKNK